MGRPTVTRRPPDPRTSADDGAKTGALVARLEQLAGLGFDSVQGKLPGVWEIDRIRRFGRQVIPGAAEL